MGDHKQLLLFGRAIPSKSDENAIIDAANSRNKLGVAPTPALASIPANEIERIAVGPSNIAFLFKNNRVARLSFEIATSPVTSEVGEPSAAGSAGPSADATASALAGTGSSSAPGPTSHASALVGSGFGSSSASANRTAKIRRMMIAARRPGAICSRAGVIVDRSRAVLPASSIPEELIAQAQVVLQGKSREVIVRELQRTNLNVNEAVNNLLSRDDDDVDDLDDAGESYLHEELLSLLDAGLRGDGGAAAVIDGDSLYSGAEYEYMMSRDSRRRDEGKAKERKTDSQTASELVQENFKFGDELQYWRDMHGNDLPPGVNKFLQISCTYSCLFALGDDGYLYAWDWNEKLPLNIIHPIHSKIELSDKQNEKIINFTSSAWRIVVQTNTRKVCAFTDDYCGSFIFDAFYTGLVELPPAATVDSLMACSLYAAFQSNNKIYWWGVHPFADRVLMFENAKKKSRDEPVLRPKEILVGAEVRTRAIPIYAAGSVGVSFANGTPTVGVLMEAAWTLTETCRFRAMTPAQYATYARDKPEFPKSAFNHEGGSGGGNAPGTTAQYKESAWNLKDVTFIYEEPVCDTAIVMIVDGSYAGIVYKSVIEKLKKEEGTVDEADLMRNHMRLMRKEELVVVPSLKLSRSPQTFQKKLTEVKLPKYVRRILSAAVENTSFRLLIEKSNGEAALLKCNGYGAELGLQHIPLDVATLSKSRNAVGKPSLCNYGDDSVLVLSDGNNSLVPLVPDSTNGIREPLYLGLGATRHVSVGVRYLGANEVNTGIVTSHLLHNPALAKNNDASKTAQRMVLVAALVAPEPRTTEPKIDSLIQNVQYCNLGAVQAILKELEQADEEECRSQILNAHTNGNKNLLHTVIMNAFSTTNKDQADEYNAVSVEDGRFCLTEGAAKGRKGAEKLDTTEAEVMGHKFDQRWKDMIGAVNSEVSKLTAPKSKPAEVAGPATKAAEIPVSAKQRQKSAILILAELASSPALSPYFEELLRQRDIHGHTPFYSAIHLRAYTAAVILWLKSKQVAAGVASLNNFVLPVNGGDSPLFVLCYNDTCSFTWTGEEHINQDIFECKTCDLVGSLCCCTECAFTCHRDHDCKLKRTSPTAYCDCWEKCGCKALVAGNQQQREQLLDLILRDTDLINSVNGRGEHLLLFLARAVGRQLVEQEHLPRRLSKLRSGNAGASTENVPEHDLEPPKFAVTALQTLLGRWGSVKSILQIGVKNSLADVPISEDLFQLNEQNGVNHLDKFVFTLLARCPENQLDALLNTLVRQANKADDDRDPKAHDLICRFVRSVARLYVFLCVASPMAANTSLNTVSGTVGSVVELHNYGNNQEEPKLPITTSVPQTTALSSKTLQPNYRAITVSGVLSLVRTSLPISFTGSSSKENKKKAINNFVLKCHRVFQVLVTYSITELLNVADALIAPVRIGVAKQTVAVHKSIGSSDVLDMMERYLNSESDLTTILTGFDSKRKSSRSRRGQSADQHGDDSDSDSDDSDMGGDQGADMSSAAATETARMTVDQAMREVVGVQPVDYSFNRPEGFSSDSNDSEDDGEDDFDGEDEHDEEVAETMADRHGEGAFDQDAGGRRDADQVSIDEEEGDEDDEEDEERYMDDDEDHYYRMDDDMGEESGEEYTDEDNYGYSSDGEQSVYRDQYDEVIDIEGPSGAEQADPNASQQSRRTAAQRRKGRRGTRRSHNENSGSAAESAGNANNEQAAANEPMDVIEERARADEVDVEPANPPTDAAALEEPPVAASATSAAPETTAPSSSTAPRATAAGRSAFESTRTPASRHSAFTTQLQQVRRQNDGNESTGSGENEGAVAAPTRARDTAVENNNGMETTVVTSVRPSHKRSHTAPNDSDVYQTKLQLSSCFALLVKVVDELSLRLLQHQSSASVNHAGLDSLLLLPDSLVVFERCKVTVNARLDSTWDWFQKIMDRIEVMLRFGNALLKSPAGSNLNPDHYSGLRSKKDRKKDRKDHAQGVLSAKRDFYNYFMSLIRSHAGENGDEMPVVETSPFRHVALVAEAYLYHISVMEIVEPRLAELRVKAQEARSVSTTSDAKALRRFYQRSESMSYPSFTTTDPHNAFKFAAGEAVPLAVRSLLLKPESDRADLFVLPVPDRTVADHVRVAREHGLRNPGYQSLASPPLRYGEVVPAECSGEDEKMQVDACDAASDNDENLYEDILRLRVAPTRVALQRSLGRWGNALVYLARAFKEDIVEFSGGDSFNSIMLNEVGGFALKHAQFKTRVEKYRAALSKDLNFTSLSREKHALIGEVFHYLNSQYTRRTAVSSSSQDAASNPPLGANRVKATFRDEPGEGSGVVRSFYAALADALTEMSYLPKEGESTQASDLALGGGSGAGLSSKAIYTGTVNALGENKLEYISQRRAASSSGSSTGGLAAVAGGSASVDRGVRTRAQQRAAAQLPPMPSSSSSGASSSVRKAPSSERKSGVTKATAAQKFVFPLNAALYVPRAELDTANAGSSSPSRSSEPPAGSQLLPVDAVHSSSTSNLLGSSSRSQRQSETNSMLLGERFYERVRSIQADYARRITGLIVNGLPLVEQLALIANEDLLTNLVNELSEYFRKAEGQTDASVEAQKRLESLPLFMKAPGHGFLSPIPGSNSTARRTAFRNVGRMIGLCLQQMEIFPLKLCRHVLKFILDRPITWYDLAFYDPAMFDSLRQIAFDDTNGTAHTDDFYESLGLTFVADVPVEEGGGVIELKPNGENIAVTKDNVLEYIHLFVEKRLLGPHVKCLEAIKQGVADVVPQLILTGLTAEDLRLILCGTEQVSIKLLESFTSFMDESSSKPELVAKFRRWFYSVISKFTDQEKQDLLFFWTGSPSLPSAEEAFTPLPTVMIRPADDHHLPTANTCISRLYLPFYSSKKILRSKLLVAIQTRDFGFV